MKRILIGLAALLACTTGCVKTRVIKVERVDQEITGNAGYICGVVPEEAKVNTGSKYREIFEVDLSGITDKETRKVTCAK